MGTGLGGHLRSLPGQEATLEASRVHTWRRAAEARRPSPLGHRGQCGGKAQWARTTSQPPGATPAAARSWPGSVDTAASSFGVCTTRLCPGDSGRGVTFQVGPEGGAFRLHVGLRHDTPKPSLPSTGRGRGRRAPTPPKPTLAVETRTGNGDSVTLPPGVLCVMSEHTGVPGD